MKTEAIEDVFELSPLQQGILFQTLYTDAEMYLQQFSFTIKAPVDVDSYRRAWQSSLDRHAALRASFFWEEVEQPVQVVQRELEIPLEFEDWSGLVDSEQKKSLETFLQMDRSRAFDLQSPPLLRIKLIRLANDCYQLIVTFHHIILDGWSLVMLFGEVTLFYEAYCFGRHPEVQSSYQYGAYIEWLQAQDQSRAESYWRRILAQYKGPAPLSIDRQRGNAELAPQLSSEQHLTLSTASTAGLRSLARTHRVTLNTLLQGAWAILLSRYTGGEDVVFGAVVSGRPAVLEGIESMIGLFINTLPVRVCVRRDDLLIPWLKQLQADQLEAREFDYSPLNKIQSLSEIPHGTPLFNTLFTFENYPIQNSGNHNSNVVAKTDFFEGNDFPLSVMVSPTSEVGIKIAYQQRFDDAAITRLLSHFRELLEAMISNPVRRLGELPLLDPAGEGQVLSLSKGIKASFPHESCIHQLFETQVEKTPGAVAVICGDQRLTYREVDQRANHLAHHLQKLGVGPECIVATYLERSLELVIGILAILKSGGAYLPLDVDYPLSRISWMLEDARPRAVLTSSGLSALPTCPCPVVSLDEDPMRFSSEPVDKPSVTISSRNLSYVVYTSGSTGLPKGVGVEHRSVVNHNWAIAEAYRLRPADRVLQFTSPAFDVFAEELFPTLLSGASVALRTDDLLSSFESFHSYITKEQITVLNLPASYWEEWVSHLAYSRQAPPSCVRLVVVGNERVRVERWNQWLELAGTGRELRNAYGPTESTITTTLHEAKETYQGVGSVPIGKAIANTSVFILDPGLRPVPIGVPGELYVGGEGIARGYLNLPDATAAAFVPDPFGIGNRLYRTGDRGTRLADGNIEFLGRLDNQVKINGHRVELEEIEAVLSSHESVKACAVAAHEDAAQHTRLIGYVVPQRAKPELWPSIGEYFLYDPVMYHAMTHDERRNRAYRAAIEREVKDKVVLDIGAGADAILTRMCLEAGAKRVYAIEKLGPSYEQARDLLARLKLTDRIILLQGESTEVELPEKVDVCVSELLGMIGSSEGVIPILNDARRFLKDGGVMIPSRCKTRIAAVTLPDDLLHEPAFTELSGPYVQQIFKALGHPIDVRVCINNFPESHVVSDDQVFEDLDFTRTIETELTTEITLTVNRDARIDGFLLWLNLFTNPNELIDVLHENYVWLPVFFPVFSPAVNASAGDQIRAACSVGPSDHDDTPDYRIQGTLIRKTGERIPFDYQSFHSRNVFKQSDFHRALFAGDWESRFEPLVQLTPTLQSFLREQLPHYMVPSTFVIARSLPLLPNAKIDRRLLPAPDDSGTRRTSVFEPPRNSIEEKLAHLWEEVLAVDRVGIYDNFFELGGDSIISIQLVSRARREGIGITVNQVFQYPNIEELAQVAEAAEIVTASQAPVVGDARLTPIQLWFFEQQLINPSHYNQAMFFEVRVEMNATLISQAMRSVVQHHDALRLRFAPTETGWSQFHEGDVQPVEVEQVDLSNMPPSEQAKAMETAAAGIQANLDISRGPTLRVALFDLGAGRSAHLLFVIHHLVVDIFSWRILMEDFWTAYSQLARSQPVQLAPKTTSFQTWAQRISEYAESAALRQELKYWLEAAQRDFEIPTDHALGENAIASTSTIVVKLNSAETQALLQEVPKAYQTQINDVLLTAVAQAFERWTGHPTILIDLEGHGREEIVEGLDVSRTVGWFTSLFPVQLNLQGVNQPGEALKSIKEQLRRIPNRGIGYGLLRYLNGDMTVGMQLGSLPQPEISFNYLGQFGHAQPESAPMVTSPASYGPLAGDKERRRTLLDVNGVVSEGEIQFAWTYSENVHRQSTIETLANDFISALKTLIEHCRSAKAGGYTPSDFSKARLSQNELDRFLGDLQQEIEETPQ